MPVAHALSDHASPGGTPSEQPVDHGANGKTAVLGLGYVGIPLARRIVESGGSTVGFDIDEERIIQLNDGGSPIEHIPSEAICAMRKAGFEATTDMARVEECENLVICVPTPLDKSREPDLGFVTATMDSIAPHLRPGHMVSLESTTWPGTTEEVLRPYLERAGLEIGINGFLVYSPEREDPGNRRFDTRTIPKIVGGVTKTCLQRGVAFYGRFIDRVVPVSSTQTAEMVKLLENIHRSVNIGLVNEMKIVAQAMKLDIHEIITAAATKPFGFTPYYPGPGIGGHCIPIDPFYLTWKAREFGLHTRFIELAGEINAAMPQYVVDRTVEALNDYGKALRGSKILVLGIAYKRDIDDMRESPSVEVMEILRRWGAEIAYSDPHVPRFPSMRNHSFDLSSVPITPESLGSFDAVLLLTDHSGFDYEFIAAHAPLVIDTRGRMRGFEGDIRRA